MLNIKRRILTTVWVREDTAGTYTHCITYGKVNPVKMIRSGWQIYEQDLTEYVLSEEEFAAAAMAREERKVSDEFCK